VVDADIGCAVGLRGFSSEERPMRRQLFCVFTWFLGCVLLAASAPARAQGAYETTNLTPAGTTFEARDYDFPGGFSAGTASVSGFNHAARRDLRTGQVTDLHPSSVYYASAATGAGGGVQVGYADQNAPGGGGFVINHAYLWRPGLAPFNLHPAAYTGSFGDDTDGVNHVGSAWRGGFGGDHHALMWRGASPNNYVNLTPTHLGLTHAAALSIHGGRQVGTGWNRAAPNDRQAVLWSGTAASAVVLLPPEGFTSATAHTIHGGEQIGEAFNHGQRGRHAVVWHDAAGSAADLHPVGLGFEESEVLGTNGSRQAGSVYNVSVPGSSRAAVWAGTADSFVNLHDFLPAGYRSSSATGIDAEGNVYGSAVTTGGGSHLFVWRPVPEPSAAFALAAAGAAGLLRRRR
jgi:hypothetical protein